MSFDLTKEQRDIQKAAREFATEELAPIADEIDRKQEFPWENFKKMAELGYTGMILPEQYGGSGCDHVSLALVMEEIGRACASTADILDTHLILCALPILKYGTEEMKDLFLSRLADGVEVGSFAITEPDAGSDVGAIQANISKDEFGYLLNGQKTFITNGPAATITIIFANIEDQKRSMTAMLVEDLFPGFSKGKTFDKLGMKAATNCEYFFANCRIPEKWLLGEIGQGMKIALDTLDHGRIGIAAQANGITAAVLEECTKYAKARVQFGSPIASNQGISFKIADMAMKLEASRLLTLNAARMVDKGERFSREAAMAKLFASETAMQAATWGIQIHGGYGYMMESPMQRYFRDAKLTEIYEGTSEVQRMVISRAELR